ATGVMRRRALDTEAPPAIRSAAVGLLWSLGALHPNAQSPDARPSDAQSYATKVMCSVARPKVLGDFLAGLFALAREEIAQHTGGSLLEACDEVVGGLDADAFLVALPSLRLAFSYFPPREREAIARVVLGIHEASPGLAHAMVHAMVHTKVDAAVVASGMALDVRVDAVEATYGLAPGAKGQEG
ncbi:MAG: DUF5682 family protein, partial [Myxococcota bacterium]